MSDWEFTDITMIISADPEESQIQHTVESFERRIAIFRSIYPDFLTALSSVVNGTTGKFPRFILKSISPKDLGSLLCEQEFYDYRIASNSFIFQGSRTEYKKIREYLNFKGIAVLFGQPASTIQGHGFLVN